MWRIGINQKNRVGMAKCAPHTEDQFIFLYDTPSIPLFHRNG